MTYFYKVKAKAYGIWPIEYDLSFSIMSNHSIEHNRIAVVAQVRRRLYKEWGRGYKILSIEEEKCQ